VGPRLLLARPSQLCTELCNFLSSTDLHICGPRYHRSPYHRHPGAKPPMVVSRSALAALYGRPRLASYRPCGRGRPQTLSSFSWRGSRTAPRPMPCAQLARRAKPAAGRRARRPQRIGYQADLDFAPPSEAWRYHTTRRRFLRNWQSALVRRVDVDRSPSDMSTAGCAVRYEHRRVRRAGGMSWGSRVLRLRDSTRTSTPRTRVSETAGREFRSQTHRGPLTRRDSRLGTVAPECGEVGVGGCVRALCARVYTDTVQ
jgi:hypothetical protein